MLEYSKIEELRELDNPKNIIPQKGAQENNLTIDVDILITGGNRGGGKTFMLCLEPKYDIHIPQFNGVIFRKEKGDLIGAINTSKIIFEEDGIYKKSDNAMEWDFNSGANLKFTFFEQSYDDFVKRFQGQELPYIGIDEITHIPYDKFKYLITCNRNSHGIKNRIWGTCNPDPNSWVRKFIDWWIGEDGYPIPERDGVIRYCFFDGKTPDDIYWGNSAKEVYNQCSHIIDRAYESARLENSGLGKEVFIKRVAFTRASIDENIKLLKSDPTYIASISTSEEARQQNLYGNWNYKPTDGDEIMQSDMDNFYENAMQVGDGIRRCTCDVAFRGGDALVMWLWVGRHIKDFFICSLDSKQTVGVVRAKLKEWQVLEDNFIYDLAGVGQIFVGFFPNAIGFIASAGMEDSEKHLYANLKSKCAYKLVNSFKELTISIEPELLERKVSGRNFKDSTLRMVLNQERKIIKFVSDSLKGKELVKKAEMKKIIGRSPDYFESLLMIEKVAIDFETEDEWVLPTGSFYI